MSFVCPLPPIKVFVRNEFLYDHEHGHGSHSEAVWCSVKSIRGEAFRFESYLPEYAALYDKLPISAFLWKDCEQPLDLDILQIWDALTYHVEVIEKPLLKGLRCEFYGKDGKKHPGEYMFTLDGANPDPRIPDFTFAESPDEHKSYNLLKLDNGQFALQPNNRVLFFDNALAHKTLKAPDFKVCTHKYTVEDKAKWRLGTTTTVSYDDAQDL
jgi:hypothetical protein